MGNLPEEPFLINGKRLNFSSALKRCPGSPDSLVGLVSLPIGHESVSLKAEFLISPRERFSCEAEDIRIISISPLGKKHLDLPAGWRQSVKVQLGMLILNHLEKSP